MILYSNRCQRVMQRRLLRYIPHINKAKRFRHTYVLYISNLKLYEGVCASERQVNSTLDLEVHSVHWHVKK